MNRTDGLHRSNGAQTAEMMPKPGWAVPEAGQGQESESLLDKPLTLPWGEVFADRPPASRAPPP